MLVWSWGPWAKDAERAVLHDWLTEEGKATGDTTVWIDAITKESHGWPQHIISYVRTSAGSIGGRQGCDDRRRD